MDRMHLSAVAYRKDGLWIVQGIEYDIRARAYAREEASNAILNAVAQRIAIDEQLGRKPLEGVKPAPTKFADMFERAARGQNHREGVEVRMIEA